MEKPDCEANKIELLVVFEPDFRHFHHPCRRMAAERACSIKHQIAIFQCAAIIDNFHENIAFGADRIFQDALLCLHRNRAPKNGGLGCEFDIAHARGG